MQTFGLTGDASRDVMRIFHREREGIRDAMAMIARDLIDHPEQAEPRLLLLSIEFRADPGDPEGIVATPDVRYLVAPAATIEET